MIAAVRSLFARAGAEFGPRRVLAELYYGFWFVFALFVAFDIAAAL